MSVADEQALHILLAASGSIYCVPIHNCNFLTEIFFLLWQDEQLVMTALRVLQHLSG